MTVSPLQDRWADVLDFWFGDMTETTASILARARLWFGKLSDVDREIASRFTADVNAAAAGDYDDWFGAPTSCLAYILLCDQFPRNIFRGTPLAFALDAMALRTATAGITHGLDKALPVTQRLFFYMPYQHAEDLQVQDRSLELFDSLALAAPTFVRHLFDEALVRARHHYDIIARFGRFPYRNEVLGRVSTRSEHAFLQKHRASF